MDCPNWPRESLDVAAINLFRGSVKVPASQLETRRAEVITINEKRIDFPNNCLKARNACDSGTCETTEMFPTGTFEKAPSHCVFCQSNFLSCSPILDSTESFTIGMSPMKV